FTSWRRATIDTEAPGTCVSATIWRFDASEYCRRFVALDCCLMSTKPVVDTCSDRSAIHRSLRQSALSGRGSSPIAYDAPAACRLHRGKLALSSVLAAAEMEGGFEL